MQRKLLAIQCKKASVRLSSNKLEPISDPYFYIIHERERKWMASHFLIIKINGVNINQFIFVWQDT